MATYATLLERAKSALDAQLSGGGAVEWSEGGQRVRITDPAQMIALIERLESLAAEEGGGSSCRPMVEGAPQ